MMTAIQAIFDGRNFVPAEAVKLPPQTRGLVLVETADAAGQASLDAAIRDYYTQTPQVDDEDASWGTGLSKGSHLAWDED